MKTLETITNFTRGQWENTVTIDINNYNDKQTAHICIKSIGTWYSTYTIIHFDGLIFYGAFDTCNILPNGIKSILKKARKSG